MRFSNGYGGIYKSKEKRRKPFRVRVTIGWDKDGKQIYKNLGYYSTQHEAISALELYHKNPLLIDNQTITLLEIYQKWSSTKFKTLEKSSIVGYESAFSYFKDLWDVPFIKIKLEALQQIVNKADGKLATQKKIQGLIGLLSDYAMANDIVEKKYSDYLILGEQKEKIIRVPFTEKEIEILWENVDKVKYVDTMLILIYTGMRVGELLNLKKENVFLDENYMIGGSKTKAGKNRIIPIHYRIKPLIEKWYVSSQCDYLIYNSVNKQLEYKNYLSRNWNEIMNALSFKHKPHDTRHTFATRMDDAGANKLCIKMILGHSLGDVTDKVYTHKTIKQLIEAVNLLN